MKRDSIFSLVDMTLLPASLLVISKFIGLFLTATIFQIPWQFRQVPGEIFASRPEVNSVDLFAMSSYSDLIMLVVFSLAISFIVVQATHFHDTHISPQMLSRLVSNNLMGLMKSSYQIYHTLTVWMIFYWIMLSIITRNAIVGITASWVAVTAILAGIIFTAIVLQDVYSEIELSKRTIGKKRALA